LVVEGTKPARQLQDAVPPELVQYVEVVSQLLAVIQASCVGMSVGEVEGTGVGVKVGRGVGS
jgi:hypothetical protein